MRTEKQITFPL